MARNGRNPARAPARRRARNGDVQRNNATRLPNLLVLKPSYTAPYKFSRSFDLGTMSRAAADQGYAWPFSLNQVPSSTEFTNLFDKYRITSVELTFSYWLEPNGTDAVWPTMYLFMDDDDAIIPTTKNSALERMSLQRVSFSPTRQTVSVRINPRWVQSLGGTTTSIAPRNMWIDMSTPGVQHFGVKAWIDNYNTSHTAGIELQGVMHFECNNVR